MLDLSRLAARLGVPFGPTLTALVEAAYRLSPRDPAGAFWRLEFYLDWIHPESSESADEALRIPGMTPAEVLPFAATSKETLHFGFWMREPGLATEARPVVGVGAGAKPRMVAPDLASFLGLVAYAGADLVRRETSAAAWAMARADRSKAGQGAGADFLRASEALSSLPGVSLAKDPQAQLWACPDLKLD